MPILTIDGNVGAGKTTLLTRIREALPNAEIELEPVEKWMQMRTPGADKSLFELYYADPVKYGFAFQIMALQTRFDNLVKMSRADSDKIVICERSFLTDYQVFARLMHTKGFISDVEMEVYKRWHEFITDLVKPQIVGSVYLKADPEVCMGRIKKRARAGEDNIQLAYIQELHDAHESWLGNDPTVLTIDVNGSVDYDAATAQIVKFIDRSIV